MKEKTNRIKIIKKQIKNLLPSLFESKLLKSKLEKQTVRIRSEIPRTNDPYIRMYFLPSLLSTGMTKNVPHKAKELRKTG